MKTPIDTIKGKIVDYDPSTGELTIKAVYTDWPTMTRREYKECLLQMVDSRPLSDKQRRACYAMINEIADYTGMGPGSVKQWTKLKFLADDLGETADKIFSLSNAPMSLVCAFQSFLARLIIEFDIPTNFPLSKYVDDVQDYVYACAIHKKCCICGQSAEAHHWKRLGMGADRKKVNHIGLPIEPLCRLHHTQCHSTSQDDFDKLWHIGPVKVDKVIAKIYDLNMDTGSDYQTEAEVKDA